MIVAYNSRYEVHFKLFLSFKLYFKYKRIEKMAKSNVKIIMKLFNPKIITSSSSFLPYKAGK